MLENAIKCIKKGYPQLLEALLERHPELVDEPHMVFVSSKDFLEGKTRVVEGCVEDGKIRDDEVNFDCKKLLAYAIEKESVDCINIILKKSPDVNVISWTATTHSTLKYSNRVFKPENLISSANLSTSNEKTYEHLIQDKNNEIKSLFSHYKQNQTITETNSTMLVSSNASMITKVLTMDVKLTENEKKRKRGENDEADNFLNHKKTKPNEKDIAFPEKTSPKKTAPEKGSPEKKCNQKVAQRLNYTRLSDIQVTEATSFLGPVSPPFHFSPLSNPMVQKVSTLSRIGTTTTNTINHYDFPTPDQTL